MQNRYASDVKPNVGATSNKNYKYDLTISTRSDPEAQPRSQASLLRLLGEEYPRIDVVWEDPMTVASNRVSNAESDTNSPFYDVFDMSYVPISMQYDGLALNDRSKNHATNRTWMERSQSVLATLMYTQKTMLPFLRNQYWTDIPEMQSGNAARIGYGVFFQSVAQSYYAVFGKYNTTLQMINWMQERNSRFSEVQSTLLLGQLLRKTIQTTFRAPATFVHDMYIDIDYVKDMNVVNVTPYAASDAIECDYKSVVGSFTIPEFKAWREDQDPETDAPYIDTTTDPAFQAIPVTLTAGNVTTTTMYDFQGLVQHILELLEPVNMVRVCRENAAGTATETLTHYVNDIIESVRALSDITTHIRDVMMELLTALEQLDAEVGMVKWVQGLEFIDPTVRREQMNPCRYELTHHVHRGLGSSGNAVWNEDMQAWIVYCLYNKWTGISGFEQWEGGHAIAMSTRTPETTGMDPDSMPMEYQQLFLPAVAWQTDHWVRVNHTFLNRRGDTFTVTLQELDYDDIVANDYLAELAYGVLPGIKITIPTVDLDSATVNHVQRAQIRKAMVRAFSICDVRYDNQDHYSADIGLEMIEPRFFTLIAERVQRFCEVRTMFAPQRGNMTMGYTTQ